MYSLWINLRRSGYIFLFKEELRIVSLSKNSYINKNKYFKLCRLNKCNVKIVFTEQGMLTICNAVSYSQPYKGQSILSLTSSISAVGERGVVFLWYIVSYREKKDFGNIVSLWDCLVLRWYDRHHGPYALWRTVRRFILSSSPRGDDGIPGNRQQPYGGMYCCLCCGCSPGSQQVKLLYILW